VPFEVYCSSVARTVKPVVDEKHPCAGRSAYDVAKNRLAATSAREDMDFIVYMWTGRLWPWPRGQRKGRSMNRDVSVRSYQAVQVHRRWCRLYHALRFDRDSTFLRRNEGEEDQGLLQEELIGDGPAREKKWILVSSFDLVERQPRLLFDSAEETRAEDGTKGWCGVEWKGVNQMRGVNECAFVQTIDYVKRMEVIDGDDEVEREWE
jgi:hypothetical protein